MKRKHDSGPAGPKERERDALGSTRTESEQNGRFDTESRGIGRTEIGQTEAGGSAEREREGREGSFEEERDRVPAGAGTARGEER